MILSTKRSHAPLDVIYKNFSQDIFDMGFMLLQCALGDLSLYDNSDTFTLKNIRTVIENPGFKKALKRNSCCFLHHEEIVREAIGFMPGVGNKNKAYLHEKGVDSSNFVSSSTQTSLLELLTQDGRFSKNFIDFLCLCLRFEYTQRLDTQTILTHEFLSEKHQCNGPLVSLNELLKTEIKDAASLGVKYAEGMAENHLEKFIEALKIVLLDKSIQLKFEAIVHLNRKTENTERRITELAHEFGLTTTKLYEKLADALNF